MSKSLAIKTLIYSIILTVISMGVMIFYANNKMVVIAESAYGDVKEGEEKEGGNIAILELMPTNPVGGSFTVKVPEKVKAEDIVVANRISDREIWIYVDRTHGLDYNGVKIEGDVSDILSAYLEEVRGGVWFKFQMKGVYECVTTLENGVLSVRTGRPKEMYDKVVAVDCDGTGVAKDVISKLCQKLTDAGVKVYDLSDSTTRLADESKSDLTHELEADFYIYLQTGKSDDTSYYGVDAYYNEEFFTPDLDGAMLSDMVVRNIVLNTYTTGHMPSPYTEQYEELRQMYIPTSAIIIGYTSNPEESLLLGKESYRDRIAEGIFNGIKEIYLSGEEE